MASKKVQEVVALWLESLEGTSPRQYIKLLEAWRVSLGRVPLEQAREIHALRFVSAEKARPGLQGKVQAATVLKKAWVLKGLYDLMVELGVSRLNPWVLPIRKLKGEAQPTGKIRPNEPMSPEEAVLLLEIPNRATLEGIRDAAIYTALLGGGLRISEAIDLNVGDIQETEAGSVYLIVRKGKGGKYREVPLHPDYYNDMQAIVEQRIAEGASFESPLFVMYSCTGAPRRRIVVRTFARYHEEYLTAAGIEKHYTLHSCRVTCGTNLAREGASLYEIQEVLGHSSAITTERYIKLAFELDQHPAKKNSFRRK